MEREHRDEHDRIFAEMLHVHELQRRGYRRFVCAMGLSLLGYLSCLVQLDPEARHGEVVGVAMAATIFALVEARDTRQASSRLIALGRSLRASRQ